MFHSAPKWIVLVIGFTAQFFFFARTFIQWYKSEKARKVESPSGYWIFSLLGAYAMFVYGVLRSDFSIILGQFVSYCVYIWNLNAKGIWARMPKILRYILICTPAIAVLLLLSGDRQAFVETFFRNSDVPLGLVLYGSAGQILFTLRFIYQWGYSRTRAHGVSILPMGFWLISLIGSGSIISYGIFRGDVVLILGQTCGFVSYIRNLTIGHKQKK